MASIWGEKIKIGIFGESHGAAIGVMINGLPPGEKIDLEELTAFLARRAPGRTAYGTTRKETDLPRVVSGIYNGKTTGAPVAALIENNNARSADYDELKNTPRPGHADYTAFIKYGGSADMRGGGHFSGRLTAPLCLAGGICLQIAGRRGVTIGAHIQSVGDIRDDSFDPVCPSPEQILAPGRRKGPAVINPEVGEQMRGAIENAANEGDSLGGVVECCLLGMPSGLGEPMFDGVENKLSQLIFAIPAVKAVEFGAGFALSLMRGSVANDGFSITGGRITTLSNNCGGILGGITNGMPVIARVGFKPTPSISYPQMSVDLETGRPVKLSVKGRHDPCIVPRAVPCVEAAAAIAALDLLLEGKSD